MSTKPSQSSLQRGSYLDKVLETLKTSGFYWGALNANQSKALLIKKKPGSFLIRASSDPKHLFTLSLRTELGVTNIRIVMCDGKFSLDQNNGTSAHAGGNQQGSPKFDCVVNEETIDRSLHTLEPVTRAGVRKSSPRASNILEFLESWSGA
ncbi:hypothetical protein pdam_00006232 [Pocillopora damicornis]|uniref:SH2 domain-containing protein n=1 Tax=Pocillopora damicornis TaxID=46731 RepID=A0A3M6UQK0_POCDA|nr:hypothetical protein pdam_00006232 [Pocillopora damicornis]